MSFFSGITVPIVVEVNTVNQLLKLVLICFVDGSDGIEIEWFQNEDKLEESHVVHMQDRKLIMDNLNRETDSGYFGCTARNKAGLVRSQKKRMGPLGYLESNDWKIDMVQVNEGLSTAFSCDGNLSDSSTNWFWRRDGKNFRNQTHETTTVIQAAVGPESPFRLIDTDRIYMNSEKTLVFNTTTASDTGIYDCLGTDRTGSLTAKRMPSELKIITLLKFTPKPNAQFLELSSIGMIPCEAEGTPTPLVKWELDNSPSLPENVEDINGTLIFKNVTFDHRGHYTCIASNSQGTIRVPVVVSVVIAPRLVLKKLRKSKYLIRLTAPIKNSESLPFKFDKGKPKRPRLNETFAWISFENMQNKFSLLTCPKRCDWYP
jgi:Immunoglobulin domain/Immunoglobulin I-set domain